MARPAHLPPFNSDIPTSLRQFPTIYGMAKKIVDHTVRLEQQLDDLRKEEALLKRSTAYERKMPHSLRRKRHFLLEQRSKLHLRWLNLYKQVLRQLKRLRIAEDRQITCQESNALKWCHHHGKWDWRGQTETEAEVNFQFM